MEFLSLKRGCTGSSESSLVKMPHCWKSHVTVLCIFFQERLQRCGKDCEDKARDKFKEGMSPSEQAALKKGLEECGIKCADSHVKLLPDMAKRIKENLAKLSY